LGHDEAEKAFKNNVSALAIAAQFFHPGISTGLGVVLNIFAVMTAFFGVYLGFHDACRGLALNLLRRRFEDARINRAWLNYGIQFFIIVLAWGVIRLNVPVLYFTSISSPIFGLVGCLIPVWLVFKVKALERYRGRSLLVIVLTGALLCLSPFLAFF
jgi:amino acid permease